jgi:hypothetical protein
VTPRRGLESGLVPDDSPRFLAALAVLALTLVGYRLHHHRRRIRRWVRRLTVGRVERRVATLSKQSRDQAAITLLDREIVRVRAGQASDASRLRLASLLRLRAYHHHLVGRLELARPDAFESVELIDGLVARYPGHAVWPKVTLARILVALGDDETAALHLWQAYALVQVAVKHGSNSVMSRPAASLDSEVGRVAVAASLSMVLRRVKNVNEAIGLARWAISIDTSNRPGVRPSLAQAGVGWAQAALALAQTDAGQDGREAARESVNIWESLVDSGLLSDGQSEGAAYAHFAMAYAYRRFDPAVTSEFGHKALTRIQRLHAAVPGRYDRRLAEVTKFLNTVPAIQAI